MNKELEELEKLGKKIVAEIIKTDTDPRLVALMLVDIAKDIAMEWNNVENDEVKL